MAEYKLTYFNTQGLAEPIRYIFAIAGVKYEDVRIPIDEFFPKLRPEVKEQFTWGTVPVLKYKDTELSQSAAIARFLARKYDLVGDNELQAAKCDEIADSVKDFMSEWTRLFTETDTARQAEIKENLISTWMPKFYKIYDSILAKNRANFIVGSRLTWGDIILAHTMLTFTFGERAGCPHLKEFPHLQKYVEAIHEIPAIKKWMQERPDTK